MQKKTSAYIEDDIYYTYAHVTSSVVEPDTDEPLGNFTGLYNHKGQPLFKPKEKIGFKTWK